MSHAGEVCVCENKAPWSRGLLAPGFRSGWKENRRRQSLKIVSIWMLWISNVRPVNNSRDALAAWRRKRGGAGGPDPLYDGKALIAQTWCWWSWYWVGNLRFFAYPELTRSLVHHTSETTGFSIRIAAAVGCTTHREFAAIQAVSHLFGQSAGSIDVLALMASRSRKGFFSVDGGKWRAGFRATQSDSRDGGAKQAGVHTAEEDEASRRRCGSGIVRNLPAEDWLKSWDRQAS